MEILMIIAALIATAPIVYSLIKTSKNDEKLDTKTKGNITLFVEASCKPVTDALLAAFVEANPLAHFDVKSGTEKEAFEALKQDTSRLVVLPRILTEKELQAFRTGYFVPRSVEFAKNIQTGIPLTLFNNQAREGLGSSFMAFVNSTAGNQIVNSMGLEPIEKKTRAMKKAPAKVA